MGSELTDGLQRDICKSETRKSFVLWEEQNSALGEEELKQASEFRLHPIVESHRYRDFAVTLQDSPISQPSSNYNDRAHPAAQKKHVWPVRCLHALFLLPFAERHTAKLHRGPDSDFFFQFITRNPPVSRHHPAANFSRTITCWLTVAGPTQCLRNFYVLYHDTPDTDDHI